MCIYILLELRVGSMSSGIGTGSEDIAVDTGGANLGVGQHIVDAVAGAWSRSLESHSLVDDIPFDEAGGDSLRFLILVYHLEERLGTALPLDLFDLGMRPSTICEVVSGYLSGRQMADHDLPQIFLLPGIGGDEPRLARLRAACAHALRIVPIDYGDWHDWVQPNFQLHTIVGHVAADIEARAPAGPLLLAGYSFGGFMAYLVAARLARAGRVIRVVALLDADNLGAKTNGSGKSEFQRTAELYQIVAGFQAGLPGNALARAAARRLTSPRWRWMLRLTVRFSRGHTRLPWDFGYYLRGHLKIGLLTKLIATHRANHPPEPIMASVPFVLFRSGGRAAVTQDRGWTGYGHPLSIVAVDGDHFNMFDPPHLPLLADRFVTALRPFTTLAYPMHGGIAPAPRPTEG